MPEMYFNINIQFKCEMCLKTLLNKKIDNKIISRCEDTGVLKWPNTALKYNYIEINDLF